MQEVLTVDIKENNMELIKIIGMVTAVIFVFCIFNGCGNSMKPIKNSSSYFLQDKKVIYSYHKSTFVMGKGEVIGADLETFTPVNDEYAYDKNSVYWNEFKINGVDKNSFKVIGKNYAKDKNKIYYKHNPLVEADVASFKLGGRYEAEDKNNYYSFGKVKYSKKEFD
jgi:hypothetical protein